MEKWHKELLKGMSLVFIIGLVFGLGNSWLNSSKVYVFSADQPHEWEPLYFEPTRTPTPITERRTHATRQHIVDYIYEVFGEDAEDAFTILECENRNLDPNAVNYNSNGTRDHGIFQLNDAYWGGEENFDYKTNIDKAHSIFKKYGWYKWSCSWKLGIKPYYER